MQPIHHEVTPALQPTNFSCCQSAMSILLSHYGVEMSPDEVMTACPVVTGENGTDFGTLTQSLATWAISLDFDVTMVTCDFQIMDLAWAGLDRSQLIERLKEVKAHRKVENLGTALSSMYVQSYVDFLEAGGKLVIKPWIDAGHLYELLTDGPLHFCVVPAALYNSGRSRLTGLRETTPDAIHGRVGTHSVVVHGVDEYGNFHITDPWEEKVPGTIQPARLLNAFSASSYLCDNLFFQIKPRS